MKNQKGISSLLILLVVVAIVGVLLYVKQTNLKDSMEKMEEKMEKMVEEDEEEYEMKEEDESTPEEIDNETLMELDALMEEIDSTSNEDMSDMTL